MSEPALAAEPALPGSLARRIGPLFAAMFFGFATIGVPLPVLPLQVHVGLGFSTAMAGFAVGLQSFATIVTRAAAGRMVDRDGAKITLVRGLVVSAGAGLAYFASLLPGVAPVPALAAILVGRLILGVGESLLITGVLNWAIIRAGPGRSGRAMSWNGMAQYAAVALGAPLGFALYRAHGFAAVALLAALLPLLALAVVLPLAPATALGGARASLRSVVGAVWKPGVALMFAGIGFASVSTFASLDFAAQGWPGAGNALFAFGGCFVLVRLVAGGLPDRLGGRAVGIISMVVEAVGQFCLWTADAPWLALTGAALTGAGCSLVYPALGVEAVRRVPPSRRGIALGAFSAFQDLAIGATGPVLGGLAGVHGPAVPFLAGAVCALAGALVCSLLARPDAA